MAVSADPADPDAIYYRQPANPKYQIVFPWGAGGNLIRHLIGLHPGEELLDQLGQRLNTVDEKFENLMTYQYPVNRTAEHWLGQEWETRHLYDESRIEHWPPASWYGLPSIFIEPDMPRISIRLYQIKNPEMNGWDIKFGIGMNKLFSDEQMPECLPKQSKYAIVKFSELLEPLTYPVYQRICEVLGLQTNREVYDKCVLVHQRWIDIQRTLWSQKYKMTLDQWVARERKHQAMLDSKNKTL